MNAYTAHLKPGREPILVKEAFSLGAFLFGPLWLAAHRAWVPAAVYMFLLVAIPRALPASASGAILIGLAVLAGLLGRDQIRWSLERRGYTLSHVLAARDEETALGRLLTFRPEIAAGLAERLR